MLYKQPLIVVNNMKNSVEFYKEVLGLEIILDFGANRTLTGGISLQTKDSYYDFIDEKSITFGGNNFELYFEEENFDDFINNIKEKDIKFLHGVKEHRWGQRTIRFYDLDMHIIEVGETMESVCKSF